MLNRPTTQDEISRDTIVNETKTNLFVEAGAGSGKTTMLVNRMIAMVEDGVPVEKICAITFTKNAALEFYERFQAKLIERSDPTNEKEPEHFGDLKKSTDESRARCLKALENIDLCFMGTIDSFCNMILSEHPSEANIPSDAKLVSSEEAKQIYTQFYVDVCNGKYDSYNKDLKFYAKRFSMFFYNPEDSFAKLMGEVMERRNVQFHVNENLCDDFFKLFKNKIEDTRKVLTVFNKDISKLSNKLGSNDKRDPIEAYQKACITLFKGWNYNYPGVEKAIKDIKNVTYAESPDALGFTTESIVREKGGKTELTVDKEDNDDPLLYKLYNYKYQNSLKLILMCIKPLEELMRKEGKLTFFDYLYYLRNMLVKDAQQDGKLIDYIYNRHSYFLIDEFQDTNPMQSEVFFYLSAIDPKKKSWKDCVPKPGSLFIVGDPKQSIYRFRSADVASYLGIKKLFTNPNVGKVLYLVNNFRSKNITKQYFNSVFEELMAEDDCDEQSQYLDIENINGKEDQEFDGVYTYESYTGDLLNDYPEMDDNKQLAKIIKTLVNNPKTKILDKDKKLRPIKFSDFMIIFSGKEKIGPCVKEFVNQDIPMRVEGKILFDECEALKTIFNIYGAVVDRTNSIPLVLALFSPVFGLNENDLAAYRKADNLVKLEFNKEYGDTPVDKALAKLIATASTISTLTPSSLYEKIMDDYEIFKYVSSENLEIVYYVLELIRGEEYNGNIITYEDAIAYMSDLLEGESGIERCLSLSTNKDAVHIANLHKVKGLEAPVVILASSGIGNKTPRVRIEYSDTPNGTKADGYLISVSNDEYFTNLIETNECKDQIEAEKKSVEFENKRLVYVAATRARNVLVVSESAWLRSGKIVHAKGLNKWNSLKVKATNGDIFEEIGENPSYKKAEHPQVSASDLYIEDIEHRFAAAKTYELKQPSDIQITPRINDSAYVEGTNENNETYSTLIGTMVHRLLEMIIMSKDVIKKQDAISNILTEYVTVELEDKANEFKKTLEHVYDVMHNGGFPQRGDVAQDILPILLESEVYSEIPFTYKNDNSVWNGIIDLAYLKDNKLHIIDWKTNKDDSNLDEHYKEQLDAYKTAVKETIGLEAEDAYIYHIDLN